MDKLTYIICGKLYNGIDAEFKENYKILVKNDLIEAVGPDIPQPESAEVIDLSDATFHDNYILPAQQSSVVNSAAYGFGFGIA